VMHLQVGACDLKSGYYKCREWCQRDHLELCTCGIFKYSTGEQLRGNKVYMSKCNYSDWRGCVCTNSNGGHCSVKVQ
jgi:hypothetical protein